MENNVIRIDPNIDPTLSAYLDSKKEGDSVDMRFRGTIVSKEDDAVTINIDDVIRLPEWKSGKDGEDDSEPEESDDEDGDPADKSSDASDDDDKSTPIMMVFGQSSKKKSKR